MEENELPKSSPKANNIERNIPRSIAFIEPMQKVELVSKKEPFTFSKFWQIVGFLISIAGLAVSIYFAWKSVQIASDNEKQNQMISELKIIVDTLSFTNKKISETQVITNNLLNETLQQNVNWRKANLPDIDLRITGKFFSVPGNDEQGVPCNPEAEYFIQNYGSLPAKKFVAKVLFIKSNEKSFQSFYGYSSNYLNDRLDLIKDNPIKFGTYIKNFGCKIHDFGNCFVVFEYSYVDNFTDSIYKKTKIYTHSISTSEYYYYFNPLTDNSKRYKILSWLKKHDYFFHEWR